MFDMDLDAFFKDLRALKYESLRSDSHNFFEGVIGGKELIKLDKLLKSYFVEPVFPSKDKFPHEAKKNIERLGGIMPGQTLYFKKLSGGLVLAMLWPWQDGQHTTVKILLKENS